MKVIPFLISTVVCALCFLLSVLHYFKASSNRETKAELIKQQAANQELQVEAKKQEETAAYQQKIYNTSQGISQLRQNDLQIMQREIEKGMTVAQKYRPSVIMLMGYLAGKKDNKGLKKILTDRKLENQIMSPEDVRKFEEQLSRSGGQPAAANPGSAPAPAPATPTTPPARPR